MNVLKRITPFIDPMTYLPENLTENDIRLNSYIDIYNESGLLSDLHRVHALATNMSQNPANKSGGFRIWLAQKNISMELNRLTNNSSPNVNAQKIFIESYSAKPGIIDLQRWLRLTKPPAFKKRMDSYKNLDKYFQAVDNALAGKAEPAILIAAVRDLNSALLALEIPPDKPKMKEKIDALIGQSSAFLNQLIEGNPEFKNDYVLESQPTFVDSIVQEGEQSLMEFIVKTTESTAPFTQDNIKLSYLGGSNNKNWLAVNNETGECSVIRLETASEPVTDYAIVDELKSDRTLSRYIAKDAFYYPTGSMNMGAYNVAVSEYTPRADLQRFRKTLASTDEIIYHVSNMCGQVANMASVLSSKGKIYPDIKAENFLIRDNGDVITADIKSVVNTDRNKSVKAGQIATSPSAAPPEFSDLNAKPTLDAEKFMSYQVGIMMYFLITDPTAEEKNNMLEKLVDEGELSFEHPVFKTDDGIKLQTLIKYALNPNPDARAPLDVIIEACLETCKSKKNIMAQEDNQLIRPDFQG